MTDVTPIGWRRAKVAARDLLRERRDPNHGPVAPSSGTVRDGRQGSGTDEGLERISKMVGQLTNVWAVSFPSVDVPN